MILFCNLALLNYCLGQITLPVGLLPPATLPEGEVKIEFIKMGTTDTWAQIRDYWAEEKCDQFADVVDEPYRKSDFFLPQVLGGYAVITYPYYLDDSKIDDNANDEIVKWCGKSLFLTGDSTYAHVTVIGLKRYPMVKKANFDTTEDPTCDSEGCDILSPTFRTIYVSTETCELICNARCLVGLPPPCLVVLEQYTEHPGPPRLEGWYTNKIYTPRAGMPPNPFYQCPFSDWASGYGGSGHFWSPYYAPLAIKQRYGPEDMPMDLNIDLLPNRSLTAGSVSLRRWKYTNQFMGHVLFGLLEEGDHRLLCGKKFAAFGTKQGYVHPDVPIPLDTNKHPHPPIFFKLEAYEEYIADTFEGAIKYGTLSIPPNACMKLCFEEFCFHDTNICPVKIVEVEYLEFPTLTEPFTHVKYENKTYPLTNEQILKRGHFGEFTAWPFSDCLSRMTNCKWDPTYGNTTSCGLSPMFPCPMAIKGSVGQAEERHCGSVWELETVELSEKKVMYGVVVHVMPDKINGWAMSHQAFTQLCPHLCGTIPVCRTHCIEPYKQPSISKRCACPSLVLGKVDRCGQFCDGCIEDFPAQGGSTEYETRTIVRGTFIGNKGNSFIAQPLAFLGILLLCF
eukprot:GHVP01050551.1.p1 GENE.GHVP01050551.1~~GHVP01050551.1.p1  ORF type:complete len:620 (+),score=73.98 GHVP01050551.1:3233-5092(+)